VAHEESFQLRLIVSGERVPGGFLHEGFQALGDGERREFLRGGDLLFSERINDDYEHDDPNDTEDFEHGAVTANLGNGLGSEVGRTLESRGKFGGDGDGDLVGRAPGFGGGIAKKVAKVIGSGIEALDFEVVAETVLRRLGFKDLDDEWRFAVAPGNRNQQRSGEVLVLDNQRQTNPLGGCVGCVAKPSEEEQCGQNNIP